MKSTVIACGTHQPDWGLPFKSGSGLRNDKWPLNWRRPAQSTWSSSSSWLAGNKCSRRVAGRLWIHLQSSGWTAAPVGAFTSPLEADGHSVVQWSSIGSRILFAAAAELMYWSYYRRHGWKFDPRSLGMGRKTGAYLSRNDGRVAYLLPETSGLGGCDRSRTGGDRACERPFDRPRDAIGPGTS